MTQILNINGQSNVNVNPNTETGAQRVAWQQFGTICEKGTTIHDVMADVTSANHINYEVGEMPLMRVPSEMVEAIRKGEAFDWNPSVADIINTHKATLRTDNNDTLGIVGKGYGIVQNSKAFDFMDFIKEASGSEPVIESYGALGYGERMFITATLGEDSYLNPNDAIKNYVVFTNSHDGSGGVMAFFTPIRVICQNTLNMAIRGCANKVVFKHTSKVDERLDWTIERNRKIAAELFSKSVKFSDKFMERMLGLKEEVITAEYARDFVGKLCLTAPAFELWKKADFKADRVEEISTRTKNIMAALTDSIEHGVGQEYNRGTKVWLLNGVTTYLQNEKNWKSQEDKFNAMMFGSAQKKVEDAYQLLMAA
jgi:phage/plasmid-like protein (TIGR03299 family)